MRDALAAALFGAGWVSDAYFMALRIPSLLRDLFAEGALSSAFLPSLTRVREKEGRDAALRFFSQAFSWLTLVTGLLCGLGVLFAPAVVGVVAHGFTENPDLFALTVQLTRILFPVLLFVSLAALWMAFLNSHERFGWPALAPAVMNFTLIATGVVYLLVKPQDAALEKGWIQGWALATTLGMALQWLVQHPPARRLGARFSFFWRPVHPEFWRMLGLMGPAVASLSVMQLNLLVNQMFASFLPEGCVTYLYYGNRLMQLPFGVLGVSLATAFFPVLAKQAAQGNKRQYARSLTRGLEGAAFVALPSLVGLCLVAQPGAKLAFEYGRFDAEATRWVAHATVGYALGLFGSVLVKVLVPAYYAAGKTSRPFWAAAVSVACTIVLNASVFAVFSNGHTRFLGLALASSLGVTVNAGILIAGLSSARVPLAWRRIFREWGKTFFACAGMASAVWGVLRLLECFTFPGERVVSVLVPVACGVVLFGVFSRFLQIRAMEAFWAKKRVLKKT